MRIIIAYPLPFDAWDTFAGEVSRFVETFKQFPPGHSDYEVWAMCCLGEPTDRIKEMFWGIKTQFVPYRFHGCDIGGAQMAAKNCNPGECVIGMTSRCFFHRTGWLKRYVQAREAHGPGIYSASTSWEGGTAHCCTRAYMIDADLWQAFPLTVATREDGQKFETGEWCVTRWLMENNQAAGQVRWDGEDSLAMSRAPHLGGIFRRGSQNEMVVWDRHTVIYDRADNVEKQRLEELANPPNN